MKNVYLVMSFALVTAALFSSQPAPACSFKVSSGLLKGDSFARLHKTQHPVSFAVLKSPNQPLPHHLQSLAEMLRKVGHRVRILTGLGGIGNEPRQIVLSSNLREAALAEQMLKKQRTYAVVLRVVEGNSARNLATQYGGLVQASSKVSTQLAMLEKLAARVSATPGTSAAATLAAP